MHMQLQADLRLVHLHGSVVIKGLPAQPLRIEISNRRVLKALFTHLSSWRSAIRLVQLLRIQSRTQPIELRVEEETWLRLQKGRVQARWWQLVRYWVRARLQ
jgi:D-arabinose 1-dehydrogenase-like Zn-dependent alcohol dehydrogenase